MQGIVAPVTGMGMQGVHVWCDDRIRWDAEGAVVDAEGLRVGGCVFGDVEEGVVEADGFELLFYMGFFG